MTSLQPDRAVDAGTAHVAKALTNRHIQFIALGGAIGAGLFMGSGEGIRIAGPSIMFAYMAAGAAVYLMARAMGSLVLGGASARSFSTHVEWQLGPWAGFVTGWSYWLIWLLVCILEITAIGMSVRYWLPSVPTWIPALIAILALYSVNRLAVRLFGELEFWLTLVKIVTILVLIIGGSIMAIFHLGPVGQEAHVGKLWAGGGLLPTGLSGFLAVLPLAVFAFGGTELIGITAAEAADPRRSVPAAINGVIARIFLFYICSLAVIMMVADWRTLDPAYSPFVLVFERAGFGGAASIVNFVVLTAILSSLNSGLFATGRMLFALAQQKDAPAALGVLDRRGLPVRGLNLSTVAMLVGVAMNYVFPGEVFGFVISLIAPMLLLTWTMIVAAHMRRAKREGTQGDIFPMPFFPYANVAVLVFFAGIIALMIADASTRPAIYSFVSWMALISAVFAFKKARQSL